MSDLRTELRDYIEAVAPAIEVEEVLEHPLQRVAARVSPPVIQVRARRPAWIVAIAAAVSAVFLLLALPPGVPEAEPASRWASLFPVDGCDLLARATEAAGQRPREPLADQPHEELGWGATGCVHDGWDSGWNYRHLLIRQRPTTHEEAEALLGRQLLSGVGVLAWVPSELGVWLAEGEESNGAVGFHAVAVSVEPYFFIVTYSNVEEALEVVDAVLIELGVGKRDS